MAVWQSACGAPITAISKCHRHALLAASESVVARAGARELVDAARELGLKLGIATNAEEEYARRALAAAGVVPGQFDVIVSRSGGGRFQAHTRTF